MTYWESIERYIDDNNLVNGRFTSVQYAETAGVDRATASVAIQGHLQAQRGKKSRTKYVLKRVGGTRTSAAQWTVGERAYDARLLGRAFSDDVKAKWLRAVEPDLQRIAQISPGSTRRVEKIIDATFDGALKVLEAAVRA